VAENYNIAMSVMIQKGEDVSTKVEESFYFTATTFSKMVNLADKFYELITALQKVK